MVDSANRTVFENLIIRDCNNTALLVENEAEEVNPFETQGVPENAPDETERLDITVRNVDFIGNAATDDENPAGAFVAMERVHAALIGCRFVRNVGATGGAVAFSGDSLKVEECDFARNNARNSGGAISADLTTREQEEESVTSVTISNCSFSSNRVLEGSEDSLGLTVGRLAPLETNRYFAFPLPARSGGAIFVAGFDQLRLEVSNFTKNSAVPAGGAVYLGDSGEVTIVECRFVGNSVSAPSTSSEDSDLRQGGALFAAFVDRQSTLDIERCLFVDNSASYGGALHFVGPTDAEFRLENSELRGNEASSGGGAAVFRNADAPEIYQTAFSNNTAYVGGAILITNGAGLSLPRGTSAAAESRFVNNVAHDGGAIFGIGGGTLKPFGTIFERNKAERNGGALCYIDSKAAGDLRVQHTRMLRNRARNGGAIYVESVSSFSIARGGNDPNEQIDQELVYVSGNQFEEYVCSHKCDSVLTFCFAGIKPSRAEPSTTVLRAW